MSYLSHVMKKDLPKILTPAEYRQRAERCRRMAILAPATRDDFLMAADTWESLAVKAESLLRYQKQLGQD